MKVIHLFDVGSISVGLPKGLAYLCHVQPWIPGLSKTLCTMWGSLK